MSEFMCLALLAGVIACVALLIAGCRKLEGLK